MKMGILIVQFEISMDPKIAPSPHIRRTINSQDPIMKYLSSAQFKGSNYDKVYMKCTNSLWKYGQLSWSLQCKTIIKLLCKMDVIETMLYALYETLTQGMSYILILAKL